LLSVPLSDFIETDKFSTTNLVLSQEGNAFFTINNIVNHNMIKYSTGCSDCTIIFLIYSTKVT